MEKPFYLFVAPYFPTYKRHLGSYIYDQVQAIVNTQKYNVITLVPSTDTGKNGDYEYEGIQVYRFKERNLPSMMVPGFYDKANFKSFDECLIRLNINIHDVAVIHSHIIRCGAYANHLKKQNPRILTILQHHGFDVFGLADGKFSSFNWHKRIVHKYGLDISNNIDLHIGVSKSTLAVLKAQDGIKVKDSYVLYNGVPKSLFHPLITTKKGCFTIGCVANFWKIKDHITLIKAVQSINLSNPEKVKAILVGTGFTLNDCKKYVSNHNLQEYIEFRDNMPHEKLIEFYNSLDLFVLPSYWDTLGCVYLEAYACGVPFMAAEGTGIKELIPAKDYERWIAPKSNPDKLAEMIMNYIEHRYRQELTISIDINSLIGDYLNYIDKKIKS